VSYPVAVQFGEAIRHSQLLRTVYVTPEIIEEAWRLFKAYGDHDFMHDDINLIAFVIPGLTRNPVLS